MTWATPTSGLNHRDVNGTALRLALAPPARAHAEESAAEQEQRRGLWHRLWIEAKRGLIDPTVSVGGEHVEGKCGVAEAFQIKQ